MTLQVSVDDTGLQPVVDACAAEDTVARIWAEDPTVWTDPVEPEVSDRLGWLHLSETSRPLIPTIEALASAARDEGVTKVVLLGMGGSSLAPETFAASFPRVDGYPTLTVLDSTHPDAISHASESIDPASTWFVVSSKSGGTLETMSLFEHFWASTSSASSTPGQQFIAVTDPGSSLEELATDRRFRAIVLADPNVGGRYSALTAFGLVPAGLIGIDLTRLLNAAQTAENRCKPTIPLVENPGFMAGALMGARSVDGNRVVYFEASKPAEELPAWAEQLIAESTGKEGRGILPVAGGPRPATASATAVAVGGSNVPDADISITFDDPYDIAGAMFVLEFATAVAGSIIGIHPFDQPDVQLAKKLAHEAMTGSLESTGDDLIDSVAAATEIRSLVEAEPSYVAIQAYVEPTPETMSGLFELAETISARFDTFVTVGVGPRFLHSTGQLHKGGFAGGVYVQLIDQPSTSLNLPGADFSFNDLIRGQADGDAAALAARQRSVIRVDLGDAPTARLVALTAALQPSEEAG
ncbi:MAG: glucose-6-phosphate isomerase [Acidimicrobiia bacterium]